MGWSDRLGTVGVWHRVGGLDAGVVVQIEDLGYRTLWLGGSPDGDLRAAERFLDATASLTVATGVVNIWRSGAEELADSFHRIERRHPGRLLLGSHSHTPDAMSGAQMKSGDHVGNQSERPDHDCGEQREDGRL